MIAPNGNGETVVFKKRKNKNQYRSVRSKPKDEAYDEAATSRLRSIGETGGYSFSEEEREDVEARIRRMWYGAKKEGSKADEEADGT